MNLTLEIDDTTVAIGQALGIDVPALMEAEATVFSDTVLSRARDVFFQRTGTNPVTENVSAADLLAWLQAHAS